jgi:DCC-interacting protein 13 alpha
LNTLQYKRKSALLEPLLGIMHAQKTFFEMGHEVTSRSEVNEFVANIGASVQGFVFNFWNLTVV